MEAHCKEYIAAGICGIILPGLSRRASFGGTKRRWRRGCISWLI
jgi:hypothetical protein